MVRPWALSAPVVVLLIALPLLRPLRSPGEASEFELSRWATVQALVEHDTLAIDQTEFFQSLKDSADADAAAVPATAARGSARHQATPPGTMFKDGRYYSDRPPALAFLLAGPYAAMHRMGWDFERNPAVVIYVLTLLGATIPAAGAAGLIYRMGRLFELRRPYRAALALAVVLGSGLVGYATVLNPHAPAAALVLAATACLLHVNSAKAPGRTGGWLMLCGLCAATAAAIDPSAAVFVAVLLAVLLVMRWTWTMRAGSVLLYGIGAAPALVLHLVLTVPITGDARPGFLHDELGGRPATATVPVPPVVALTGAPADEDAGFGPVYASSYGGAEPGVLSEAPAAPPEAGNRPEGTARAPRTEPTPPSASKAPATAPSGDEADESAARPRTGWKTSLGWALSRAVAALLGPKGLLTHFPVVLIGVLGIALVVRRHWPAPTKVLAGGTLLGSCAIIAAYVLGRADWGQAMFGPRWFIVFLPLALFWGGAWLRRPHHKVTWTAAALLLAFSATVSLLGAATPFVRAAPGQYTVVAAVKKLTAGERPTYGPARHAVILERQEGADAETVVGDGATGDR